MSAVLLGADAVVVDSVRRGELLRVVLGLPADRPTFAASQATVLSDPRRWTAGMGRRTVWVSTTPRGTTLRRQRERLLRSLRRAHAVRERPNGFPGLGDLVVVRRADRVSVEARARDAQRGGVTAAR